MDISFRCPECDVLHTVNPREVNDSVACSCGATIPVALTSSLVESNTVDRCPRCEESAFYVQRDFNQKVGAAIMALFALVGLVFVYYRRPMFFYLCLGLGALADLVLYLVLPSVTVCYKCKAAFRNVEPNPEHEPFDLHIADVYDNRSKG